MLIESKTKRAASNLLAFDPVSKQIQWADSFYVGNGTSRFVIQVICTFAIAHLYL